MSTNGKRAEAIGRRILRTGSPTPIFEFDHSFIVGDDKDWPDVPDCWVSFDRFHAREATALTHPVGVRVAAGDDVASLQSQFDHIEKIEIVFEAFTDGRGYSQAKILRDQLDFEGEIRASGDVGADQLHYLREVGFDAFELRPNTSDTAALAALARFTVNYRDPQTRVGATR